jgi:hypothetical protein
MASALNKYKDNYDKHEHNIQSHRVYLSTSDHEQNILVYFLCCVKS